MSREERACGNWERSRSFKLYKNGPAEWVLRSNLELKPDMKPVAKGNSNHLKDQTRARCKERPGGSELWPGNFTKDSILFCRFPFEDLFLCLPMLSAPPVPTWLRVRVAWIQEELAANRCPEDCDRKPIRNSFLMSPH